VKSQVVAEVSIVPLGTGSTSLSQFVSGCLKVLDGVTDVKYQLTPMGTILEGPLDRVLALVEKMHQVPFEMGVQRVLTTLKIDDRRDKVLTMEGKVKAVLKKRIQKPSRPAGRNAQ
jgi:uncharacterized protein (TIGR00106 family)